MGDSWRESNWGDEISLEYGKALRGHDQSSGKYRVYGSNGPIGWTDEPLVQGPGVILGRKGAYRGVEYAADAFFVIDTAYYVVPKRDHNMRWLYYAIKQHKLGEIDDGSPIPSTTRAAVYVRELEVPPPREQQAIAHILGTLDDKIELNRRMSETLEAMAQALFRPWFVDLDCESKAAADLIREGILEIGDGYRAKNAEMGNDGLPFIRAADLKNGFDTTGAERLSADSVARAGNKTSRSGDVAFTSKGTIGRFARVSARTPRFVYSPQVCFWRSLEPTRLHPAILYCWMQSAEFRTQIMAVADQTDMAPYVSLQDQRRMMVPEFPSSQWELGERIETLLARQTHNSAEIVALAQIRDALLPKLISGEIRVKDAERVAGKAI